MKIKLTTLIIIVVLAVAGTVGVMLLVTNKDFGLMRTDKNDDGIVINEQENLSVVEEKISNEIEEMNGNSKIVKKLDDSKEIVYTSYYKKLQDNDGTIIEYNIPTINIDSEDAKNSNKNINELQKIAEKYYAEYEESNYVGPLSNIEYVYYLNSNILSVLIKWGFPSSDQYKLFNIDIYTGDKVSSSEILKHKNKNENDFLKELQEYYKKTYPFKDFADKLEGLSEDEKNVYIDGYNYILNRISSEIDNIDMYLNEDGKMVVILPIAPTAGDNFLWEEWNTNL